MVTTERCDNHPRREAVVRCASCRRRLCDACWLRKVQGEPWCERCIHYLSSTGANVALGVGFFLCAVAVTWVVVRWWPMDEARAFVLVAFGVPSALVASVYVGTRRPPVDPRRITERLPEEVPPPRAKSVRGHPYRVALRRATRVMAAPVSGLKVAGLVLLAMLCVALALPNLLHLRRIVEFELVAVGFWLLWGLTGTVLLYRGHRVAHDHVLATPRSPWKFLSDDPKPDTLYKEQTRNDRWFKGCLNLSGCGLDFVSMGVVTILLVAFGLAWLLAELVLPVLFFLAYLAVRSPLAAVANDDHDCQGNLTRSLAWGFLWSSVYVLPLLGTLAVVHWFYR